jgi:hypothetical protein
MIIVYVNVSLDITGNTTIDEKMESHCEGETPSLSPNIFFENEKK